MNRVELEETGASGFRNLAVAPVQWASGANVVLGENGEGKTNLLESVVVIGNARSFRTTSVRPQVTHGESAFMLRGTIRRGGRRVRLEQTVELLPSVRRTLRIDGAETNAGEYLQVCPVVSVSADDRHLVVGGPEVRRAYLDRCAFLLRPSGLEVLRRYRRVLRQRNAALTAQWSGQLLDPWDDELAGLAAEVVRRRRTTLDRLARHVQRLWRELAAADAPDVQLDYAPETWAQDLAADELQDAYRTHYERVRGRDRELGHTRAGPHRHDLRISAGGRSARGVLSSGQIKVLTVALRLAVLEVVEETSEESLPVVVDDVDAELDPSALRRVIKTLGDERQLIVSSAHDELLRATLPRARQLWVRRGRCMADGSGEHHEC